MKMLTLLHFSVNVGVGCYFYHNIIASLIDQPHTIDITLHPNQKLQITEFQPVKIRQWMNKVSIDFRCSREELADIVRSLISKCQVNFLAINPLLEFRYKNILMHFDEALYVRHSFEGDFRFGIETNCEEVVKILKRYNFEKTLVESFSSKSEIYVAPSPKQIEKISIMNKLIEKNHGSMMLVVLESEDHFFRTIGKVVNIVADQKFSIQV